MPSIVKRSKIVLPYSSVYTVLSRLANFRPLGRFFM